MGLRVEGGANSPTLWDFETSESDGKETYVYFDPIRLCPLADDNHDMPNRKGGGNFESYALKSAPSARSDIRW